MSSRRVSARCTCAACLYALRTYCDCNMSADVSQRLYDRIFYALLADHLDEAQAEHDACNQDD
ncbi:hypothetical protein BCAR13_730052 [Paraburkholderia caribensis]|nr:hypothetical protein BCAR13_730052 [Paraburkholderia caribensis]